MTTPSWLKTQKRARGRFPTRWHSKEQQKGKTSLPCTIHSQKQTQYVNQQKRNIQWCHVTCSNSALVECMMKLTSNWPLTSWDCSSSPAPLSSSGLGFLLESAVGLLVSALGCKRKWEKVGVEKRLMKRNERKADDYIVEVWLDWTVTSQYNTVSEWPDAFRGTFRWI